MPNQSKPKEGSIPDLSGLISKEDLHKKGSFATYMNWARTTQYLREHAPGWDFHLKGIHLEGKNEEYVWPAPDGSGYLMCFFQNGERTTPLFPFPIMDNRNNPLPMEKISARDVSDSHRRGLCACAAFVFGLAYELWARIEIEEAEKVDATPVKKEIARSPQRGANAKKVANEMIIGTPLDQLFSDLQSLNLKTRSEVLVQFKALNFPQSTVKDTDNKGMFALVKTDNHIKDVRDIMNALENHSP